MDCQLSPRIGPTLKQKDMKKETAHEKEFFEDFTDIEGLVANGGRKLLGDQIKCTNGTDQG
jgi:hypothetical protein